MGLTNTPPTSTGIIGLLRTIFNFFPIGTSQPQLPNDETAIVNAIGSITGYIANGGYISVANIAALPSAGSVANGCLAFVRTQRSWYRSDGASSWFRVVEMADASWSSQASWGIDPTLGSDENVGSPASPLATYGEFIKRVPALSIDTTVTVAAGASIPASDPMTQIPIINQNQTNVPTLTVIGARTLGSNNVVASSSNEVGNAAPLIDASVALSINVIIQATSGASNGATSVVESNIAGTQFRTSVWRDSAGLRTVPPVPGDTIATVSNPSVSTVDIAAPAQTVIVQNLNVTSFFPRICGNLIVRTCNLPAPGTVTAVQNLFYQGCAFSTGPTFSFLSGRVTLSQCGINRVTLGAVTVSGGAVVTLTDTIIEGASGVGLDISNGGRAVVNSLAVFDTVSAAIDVHDGGFLQINGTLYGAGNAGKGTRVREGGKVFVLSSVTPTLAATGQELELEATTTAIPTVAGAPTPIGAVLCGGSVVGGVGPTYASTIANAPSPVVGNPTMNAVGDYTLTFSGQSVASAIFFFSGNSGGSTNLTFDIVSTAATTVRVQVFQATIASNASFFFVGLATVAPAQSMQTWAAWVAVPFSRNSSSFTSQAAISNNT